MRSSDATAAKPTIRLPLTEIVERALAPREVRLVLPEVRDENPGVQLVGEIRAFDTVTISSEIAGKVDKVFAEVGDRVAAGAPLAEVDRETFKIYLQQAEANLAAANADLALAGKELERKQDLRSDETISQSALDQAMAAHDLATARVAAAQAALALASRNYDRSIVRAPAAGAITQRYVVAGQWAEIGVGLFEEAIGNKVKVSARVPAAWAPKLAALENFTFSIGVNGPVHTARIYSMQPVVEEASRSFEIVGTAVNDGSMKPGMFANVTLESPTVEQSLWLPVVGHRHLRSAAGADDRKRRHRLQTDPDRTPRRWNDRDRRRSGSGRCGHRRRLRPLTRHPSHVVD